MMDLCSLGIFGLPTCHKSSEVPPNSHFHHSIETSSSVTPITLKEHSCSHIHTTPTMPRLSRHNPAAAADVGMPPAGKKKSQQSSNTSIVATEQTKQARKKKSQQSSNTSVVATEQTKQAAIEQSAPLLIPTNRRQSQVTVVREGSR
jgi:hypothetical protein